jgi:hypothetical protein
MEWWIGALCFVGGACFGFLIAAICILARDLDELEEYEHKLAGR